MDAVLPLAVAVPLAAAAIITIVGRLVPRVVADVMTVAAALATAVVCAIELQRAAGRDVVHWFGRWTPRNGFALGIDLVASPLAAGAAPFAACATVAAAVLGSRYLDVHSTSFHALLLL